MLFNLKAQSKLHYNSQVKKKIPKIVLDATAKNLRASKCIVNAFVQVKIAKNVTVLIARIT